jgi:hypothetical protein
MRVWYPLPGLAEPIEDMAVAAEGDRSLPGRQHQARPRPVRVERSRLGIGGGRPSHVFVAERVEPGKVGLALERGR